MKKFLSLILFICIFNFVGIISVSAATITGNATVNVGKTFSITISDGQSTEGYDLDYNKEYLEYQNGTCSANGKLVSASAMPCTITFKVKSDLSLEHDQQTEIKLNDINQNEATNPFIVTIKANKSAPAPTEPTTTTTAQEQKKSENANLKTIEIKADDGSVVLLSPIFSSTVLEYEAIVASTVRTIQINATMEDSKATMIISNNANEELIAGENNKITITVTAEDGTKKVYTLNIKREALTADATLKELVIEEDGSFELEEDVFTYTVKVGKNVSELTISYVLSDENATVEIEGNQDLEDGSVVRIIVTAEDGTKKVYTLNIVKEVETTKANTTNISAEKNPLIIMALSIVAFGLIGGIIYVIKK